MLEHIQHIVDPCESDLCVVELPGQRLHLLRAEVGRPISPSVSGRLAMRAGLVTKRGSVASSGRPSTLVQNTVHSRSFWMEMRIGLPSAVWNTP